MSMYPTHAWDHIAGRRVCAKCGEAAPATAQCRGRRLRSEDFGRAGAAIEAAATSERIAALESALSAAEREREELRAKYDDLEKRLCVSGACHVCGEPIDNFAANPMRWGVPFPVITEKVGAFDVGKMVPHHVGCVFASRDAALVAAVEGAVEQLKRYHTLNALETLRAALQAFEGEESRG